MMPKVMFGYLTATFSITIIAVIHLCIVTLPFVVFVDWNSYYNKIV